MNIRCPRCKIMLELDAAAEGEKIECGACHYVFASETVAVTGEPTAGPAASSPPPPPHAIPLPGPPLPGWSRFISPNTRSRLAIGFMLATAITCLVSLWSSMLQLDMLHRVQYGYELAVGEAQRNDDRELMIGLLTAAMDVTAVVMFFCWEYRVYKNLRALSPDSMRFSPGGSVGWYFCPIVNLWKPVQAMNDVARGSVPAGAAAAGGLICVWWAGWLIDSFLSQVSFRTALKAETVAELVASTRLDMACCVATMVSALLTAFLIRYISCAQTQRFNEARASADA